MPFTKKHPWADWLLILQNADFSGELGDRKHIRFLFTTWRRTI